jgi:hypothetical protein
MALDTDAIVARIRQEAARRLLAAAITLQSWHREDLSVGNPAPHDHPAPVSDYPRLRTGGGRANVVVEPASVAGVMAQESVTVGYRPGGMHLYWLGNRGWKWITDTYARERARINAIFGGGP